MSEQPVTPHHDVPSAETWAYVEQFVPISEAAHQARTAAAEFSAPAISPSAAAALTFLAKVVDAKAVVEIGTGGGVSGLALFAGMQPDGILTSVDIEPEHQAAARAAFTAVGIASRRFRLIAGAAGTVLPKLSDGAYDVVFVDADKSEYPGYVEQAIRLLRPGGVLAVDNALWHNRVADPQHSDHDTQGIREANELVRASEELVEVMLPLGDGLLVAVRT